MKTKQALIASILISAFANADSGKSLVLSCSGPFWDHRTGSIHGGEYTGQASIKIYRRKAESLTWYSAEVSAEGDPENPGVKFKDHELIKVYRSFHPGDFKVAPIATSFEKQRLPGDSNASSLHVSLTSQCLPNNFTVAECPTADLHHSNFGKFNVQSSGKLYSFSPTITSCSWSSGEGHWAFYR